MGKQKAILITAALITLGYSLAKIDQHAEWTFISIACMCIVLFAPFIPERDLGDKP